MSRWVWRRAGSAALPYVAAAGISTVAGLLFLEIWKADLHVPFTYWGDGLLHALIVKSTLDNGWWWVNPSLGAPGSLELYDYPVTAHDTVHLLVIKAMSLFSSDWALLFNLYFLLGFPLITLSAMAVLRHFRVGYSAAIAASVLYSFLPSRLIKGEGHLFLDVFYEVPLAVLVLLWVCGDEPPLFADREGRRWPRIELRRTRSWGSVLVCLFLATTSFYYAAFAGFLLFAVGIWGSRVRRSTCNALSSVALASVIAIGIAASVLPSVAYHARHGPNPISERVAYEAEIYGLRIVQLLMPADRHRLQVLMDLKNRYNRDSLPGESRSTSLGGVGAAGFLLLLGAVLSGKRAERGDDLRRRLAVLNLMAVLLGTIGGFGSLFAFLVHPQVRGYLRLNVYIGFFGLFAVALVLDRLERQRPNLGRCVILAVLVVGLFDQSTWAAVPPYAEAKREYACDADLVRRIEAALPAGTMVFELPYMRFPEMPIINGMDTYDPIRPYLHSNTLRWSYPTVRNRPGDLWAQDVSSGDPSRILRILADTGFGGVLVDRDGYADHGSVIEAAFRTDLGVGPIVSDDGRLAFYDVRDYARSRHASMSTDDLAFARDVAAHPVSLSWDEGCSGVEYEGEHRPFRWCTGAGLLRIHNALPFRRSVSIRMKLYAAQPPAKLKLDGLLSGTIDLVGLVTFAREISLPPGDHVVRFACDGKPAYAPGDSRTLVWHISSFTIDEIRVPGAP